MWDIAILSYLPNKVSKLSDQLDTVSCCILCYTCNWVTRVTCRRTYCNETFILFIDIMQLLFYRIFTIVTLLCQKQTSVIHRHISSSAEQLGVTLCIWWLLICRASESPQLYGSVVRRKPVFWTTAFYGCLMSVACQGLPARSVDSFEVYACFVLLSI